MDYYVTTRIPSCSNHERGKSNVFTCKLCYCTSHVDWLFTEIIETWTYEDLFSFVTSALSKCSFLSLSNSENHEHLKNFRNVDCVLANHNKVQDTRANLKNHKLITVAVCPYWLISRNIITFHKYFWCSRVCEFHSKKQ